jgi:hypothetical protein
MRAMVAIPDGRGSGGTDRVQGTALFAKYGGHCRGCRGLGLGCAGPRSVDRGVRCGGWTISGAYQMSNVASDPLVMFLGKPARGVSGLRGETGLLIITRSCSLMEAYLYALHGFDRRWRLRSYVREVFDEDGEVIVRSGVTTGDGAARSGAGSSYYAQAGRRVSATRRRVSLLIQTSDNRRNPRTRSDLGRGSDLS